MVESAIYTIRNLLDGTQYIGSTIHLSVRWAKHKRDLRKAAHDALSGQPERQHHKNLHLQRAWVRDGEDAFVFEVMEECPPDLLREREQYYLDTATTPLYNIARDTAAPMRGRKQTPEHIAKRIAAVTPQNVGRQASAETRAKLSAVHRGRKRSPETRANMSAAAKAKKGKYPISDSRRAALQAFATTEAARALYSENGKRGSAARWHKHLPETTEG